MAKYRAIQTEFWTDSKIMEEMSAEDKYFFLYILSNPNTTQIGIYEITRKQIAFDMGYSIESINAILDRFINKHQLIKYNEDTRELAIKNWGKHGFTKAGKPVEDCVISELKEVKDISLIEYVSENVKNEKIKNLYLAHLDSLSDTFTIRDTIRDTIRGQKEKQKEKEKEKQKEKQKEPNDDILIKIIEKWNSIKEVPNIINIKNDRLSKTKARIKDYGEDTFFKVLDLVQQSDFLLGKTTDWNCTYDWVIKPLNFTKILEGNYANKNNNTIKNNGKTLAEYDNRTSQEERLEYVSKKLNRPLPI